MLRVVVPPRGSLHLRGFPIQGSRASSPLQTWGVRGGSQWHISGVFSTPGTSKEASRRTSPWHARPGQAHTPASAPLCAGTVSLNLSLICATGIVKPPASGWEGAIGGWCWLSL